MVRVKNIVRACELFFLFASRNILKSVSPDVQTIFHLSLLLYALENLQEALYSFPLI